MIRRRRWQTSPVTGESTEETVKPLRRECRVESGEPVVTMLVCFFILHARLRVHRAPGIPCALCLSRANVHANLGRYRAARMPKLVMAGLVPAIHVFAATEKGRRGCPGQARARRPRKWRFEN